MEWETIFVNHISNMELISKIFKELIQLNSKRHNNNNKNPQRTRFQNEHRT